jgi:hypothetical protein
LITRDGDHLFNVVPNLVCKYFFENFCFCVHWGNWSIVLFCCILIWFGISIIMAL